MDLYSRNGKGRPASSDHFIRTNASVRGSGIDDSITIRRNHWKFDIAFPRALSLITIAFDVIYPKRSNLHV